MGNMTIRRRRPPSPSSLVDRKRTGTKQVRKTVYFDPQTVERLDRYTSEHRLTASDVVEEAVTEYLARASPRAMWRSLSEAPDSPAANRRHSTAPPPARDASPEHAHFVTTNAE